MVVPFSFDACTIDVNCTYEVGLLVLSLFSFPEPLGLICKNHVSKKRRALGTRMVLSLALRGFSPGTPVKFSLHLKNQYFQIPIRPGIKKTVNHFAAVLPPNHYLLFINLLF